METVRSPSSPNAPRIHLVLAANVDQRRVRDAREVAIDNFYIVTVAHELRQCGLVTDMYRENSLIREWFSWEGWYERLDNRGVLHGGDLQGVFRRYLSTEQTDVGCGGTRTVLAFALFARSFVEP